MPKISLESNCIQIELTAAEAANFGCGLNRFQLLRKKKKVDGGMLLELSSIDLTKSSESSEVVVLIPPAVIYPVSSDSPAPLTPKPADSLSSFQLESPTSLSEKHSSGVSGYRPDHGVLPLGETGMPQPTSYPGEPAPFFPTAAASPAVIRRRSPVPGVS